MNIAQLLAVGTFLLNEFINTGFSCKKKLEQSFLSIPCDLPDFSHLGGGGGSHSLNVSNSEMWNPIISLIKRQARKKVQSFQCISGRFENYRGRLNLDLAGVHHDSDPLSHGLRN